LVGNFILNLDKIHLILNKAMTIPTENSNSSPDIIKVVIIEDEREVREGLAMLIGGTSGFDCIGKYRSIEDALYHLRNQKPDVVLTDIGLPGMDGIEGIRVLRKQMPDTPFIALTVYDDNERIFAALCAGACGYLLKNTQPSRLLEALREVVAGGAPMSPQVARNVVALFRDYVPPPNADYQLTPQEKELLKLLVEGHSYKTAAHHLNISYHTVSFHLRNVYEKLQVHSMSEAVSKALREKLV
jgi:DNA-binding NarL/FixJ family response regulator